MHVSQWLPRTAVTLSGFLLIACHGVIGPAGSGATGISGSTGQAGSPVATGQGGSSISITGAGGAGAPTVLSRVGLAARLSKFEYQNSVADVLGVALLPAELDAAAGGIPDDTGDGVLKHLADKQTSVEQHALAYFQVADGVAKRADMAALSTRLGTCTKATADCGAAFVRAVGRRLFRRPLEQRETDAMLVVYNAALGEKLAFAEAARWALRALLQAPQFLFRMDKETSGVVNQPRDLDGYELAALLSSFLWVSVPDEELLTTAGDGSLVTPEILDAQVKRMLADPKARRLTEVFAAGLQPGTLRVLRGRDRRGSRGPERIGDSDLPGSLLDPGGQHRGPVHDHALRRQPDGGRAPGAVDGRHGTADGGRGRQPTARRSHVPSGDDRGHGRSGDGVVRQSRQVPDGAAPVPESQPRPLPRWPRRSRASTRIRPA